MTYEYGRDKAAQHKQGKLFLSNARKAGKEEGGICLAGEVTAPSSSAHSRFSAAGGGFGVGLAWCAYVNVCILHTR